MVKGLVFLPVEFVNKSYFWFQQMIEKYIGKNHSLLDSAVDEVVFLPSAF
jgi:hypothetical protein